MAERQAVEKLQCQKKPQKDITFLKDFFRIIFPQPDLSSGRNSVITPQGKRMCRKKEGKKSNTHIYIHKRLFRKKMKVRKERKLL